MSEEGEKVKFREKLIIQLVVILLFILFFSETTFCRKYSVVLPRNNVLSSSVEAIGEVTGAKIVNPESLPFSAMQRIAVAYSDSMFTRLVEFQVLKSLTPLPLKTKFAALCLQRRAAFHDPPAGTITFQIIKGSRVYITIDRRTSWISSYTLLFPALEKALLTTPKKVVIKNGTAYVINDGEIWLKKAFENFKKGYYARAAADYQHGFITLTENHGPFVEHEGHKKMRIWAEAFYQAGDYENAVKIFQQVFLRYNKKNALNRVIDCVRKLNDKEFLRDLLEEQLKYSRMASTATRKGEEQVGRDISVKIADCYREIPVLKRMIMLFKEFGMKMDLRRGTTLLERLEKQKKQELEWLDLNAKFRKYKETLEYEKALEVSRKAIAIAAKRFGRVHLKVAMMQNYMAEIYLKVGKIDRAEMIYSAAWDTLEHQAPGLNVAKGCVLDTMAQIKHAQRKYSEAEKKYAEALMNLKVNLPYHHPLVINSMKHLSKLYGDMKKRENKHVLDVKIGQAEKVSRLYNKSRKKKIKTVDYSFEN